MSKMNNMNYDEAIKKLETIISSLESDEAVSMEQYKQKAIEAKELISFCRKQLIALDEQMKSAVSSN